METVLFLSAVLVGWLGLTVLNAHSRTANWLSARLGATMLLVPRWNFFSPHPGEHDYHLLYRGRRSDTSTTAWQRVEELDYRSRRLRYVWNPDVLRYKAVFDATQELVEALPDSYSDGRNDRPATLEPGVRDISLDGAEFSTAYLTFLNLVTRKGHSPLVQEVQFAIVRCSRQTGSNQPVFISDFHALDPE